MRKVLFLTTVMAFVFTSTVWAADISGNWAVKMSGRQGEVSMPMVVKADGEKLTITATHPTLQAMEGTGTIKGDAVDFSLKATGQMPIEFVFTGKVTGNKMAGTREVKMSGGGQGGPPGAGGQAGGGQAGGPPSGGQAGGGQAGGTPSGGQAGGGQAGGPPNGGQAGGQGGGQQTSNAWTAEKN